MNKWKCLTIKSASELSTTWNELNWTENEPQVPVPSLIKKWGNLGSLSKEKKSLGSFSNTKLDKKKYCILLSVWFSAGTQQEKGLVLHKILSVLFEDDHRKQKLELHVVCFGGVGAKMSPYICHLSPDALSKWPWANPKRSWSKWLKIPPPPTGAYRLRPVSQAWPVSTSCSQF